MLFQIVLMITMFANIGSGNNPDVSLLFNYFMFFPIIMILIVATQFGWFWSVGIGLQSKVPENVKMKTKKFKIFFTLFSCTFLFIPHSGHHLPTETTLLNNENQDLCSLL